jgi:16S rRNA (adenine1518-N6/adenine1519-N6)-dimethyltransferase
VTDPRTVLRGAGLRPKKGFGQNFLVAEPIARAIAAACVHDDEVGRARVVEIGAGTGALTRWLAERAREVVAIERDRDLVPLLRRDHEGLHTLERSERADSSTEAMVRVVEGDAKTVDLAALLGAPEPGSPRVLCGNLPYSITGALMRRAVEEADRVERVVFMVQSEVADRLGAKPGTKDWGALTVFVRAAFDVRRLMRAPPGAFHPPPDVTSAVVELVPVRPPRARETDRFRALVRGAFESRRKTLRNAWSRIAPAPAIAEAAQRARISLDARGETLDVEDFDRMADELSKA